MKRSYIDSVHFSGRIWMVLAIFVIMSVPTVISIYFDAWPELSVFMIGMMGIAPTFWTVAIIEVFTYVPMLGTGGTYLGFVTGNLTNLKVPCAVNSMQAAKVEPGSEKGEIISTIAIAVSSIVTTLIIAAGALLLAQIRPVLEAPALAPAFANILPALFGALGVALISRNWKVAVTPLVVMVMLFLLIPGLAGMVGILVPVGVVIAVVAARVLYKGGKL